MREKNLIYLLTVAVLVIGVIIFLPGVWRFIDDSKIISALIISAVLLGVYYISRYFVKPKLIMLPFDNEVKVNYVQLSDGIYSNISLPFKFALIDIWSDDVLVELGKEIKIKTSSAKSDGLNENDYFIEYADLDQIFLPRTRDFKIRRYQALLVDGQVIIKKRFFPNDGDLEFETEFKYRSIFGRKLVIRFRHKVINLGPSNLH